MSSQDKAEKHWLVKMKLFITIALFVAVSALPPPNARPLPEDDAVVIRHWDPNANLRISRHSIKNIDALKELLAKLVNGENSNDENNKITLNDVINALKHIHEILNDKDIDDDNDDDDDDEAESNNQGNGDDQDVPIHHGDDGNQGPDSPANPDQGSDQGPDSPANHGQGNDQGTDSPVNSDQGSDSPANPDDQGSDLPANPDQGSDSPVNPEEGNEQESDSSESPEEGNDQESDSSENPEQGNDQDVVPPNDQEDIDDQEETTQSDEGLDLVDDNLDSITPNDDLVEGQQVTPISLQPDEEEPVPPINDQLDDEVAA